MLKTPYDNIHPLERFARLVLGAAMIALIFSSSASIATSFASNPWITLASVYPVMTAIMAWDPLYAMLGQLPSPAPRKSKPLSHAPA
ncbi:hypothetical protein Tel_16175 [Candidatus Tenderia electrophaga]|jgi:hypothetical protein|uniref:Inner membrane protein YgaP-like transmembrane domain-containing protein n=1 Tax=Candidatus Tenderia electrophaga TaxID=1748243 RepID=A0A0S2THD4_9GAMM|nr:hypothetical protein Tel_16175 [Candidatus Tenderia electrophaga]